MNFMKLLPVTIILSVVLNSTLSFGKPGQLLREREFKLNINFKDSSVNQKNNIKISFFESAKNYIQTHIGTDNILILNEVSSSDTRNEATINLHLVYFEKNQSTEDISKDVCPNFDDYIQKLGGCFIEQEDVALYEVSKLTMEYRFYNSKLKNDGPFRNTSSVHVGFSNIDSSNLEASLKTVMKTGMLPNTFVGGRELDDKFEVRLQNSNLFGNPSFNIKIYEN
ncbi:MAG: hypothetical protein QE271_09025 [Bacteriovoracaceae bacterium]|nr:hypothetical protein [Bacteriovoracaceae bacterium]